MIDSNSENDEITRLGSIWAIPNERTPGVSIIQPGFNASATAEEEVCLPLPVTSFTFPISRSESSESKFTNVDFPTPE